ncbi:MAG: hypothetical protein ACR2OB_10700 [Solirubrobacteraceae bacterium]
MPESHATPAGSEADLAPSRGWESMTLTYVGEVGEVLQGGGGKLSTVGQDPGDARKPPGGG